MASHTRGKEACIYGFRNDGVVVGNLENYVLAFRLVIGSGGSREW